MANEICTSGVPHLMEPDDNFCCKMTYMRANGAFGVTFQGGRREFHDSGSLRERERQAIADARAGGIEPERFNPSTAHAPKRKKTLVKDLLRKRSY